jgi:hypothetical protein
MDNPITPEKQNAMVEDALNTYPVVPMPRDITGEVMRRIQAAPAPRPFRVTWTDLALSLIIAVCIGAVWFGVSNLPPIVIAQIRKESILFYQHVLVNVRWLMPVLFFGLAGFLAALTIPYLSRELKHKST